MSCTGPSPAAATIEQRSHLPLDHDRPEPPQDPRRREYELRRRSVQARREPLRLSYTITIRNEGDIPARLMTRHWVFTDANGKVKEVRGEGVVGEQPYLLPGQGFR